MMNVVIVHSFYQDWILFSQISHQNHKRKKKKNSQLFFYFLFFSLRMF